MGKASLGKASNILGINSTPAPATKELADTQSAVTRGGAGRGNTRRRDTHGKQQLKQLRHFKATWRDSALVFHFTSDILRHAGIYGSVDVGFTSTHHLGRVTEGDTNRRDHLGNKQQLKQLRHV